MPVDDGAQDAGRRVGGSAGVAGLFSNNVPEERVMRLMETKSVLTGRAKLVRLASGATAMATATLMATSFHVVPTMAAANSPVVQTAVLRATVLGSADAPVVVPATCPQMVEPAVVLSAPVAAKQAVAAKAPVSARAVVVPIVAALCAGCHGGPGRIASAAECACDGVLHRLETGVARHCSASACDTAGAWACSCNTGYRRSCSSSR